MHRLRPPERRTSLLRTAKSAASDTVLLSRAFDDGTTFLVRGAPRADGAAEGFAISEAYCTRAECTCRTVSVRVRRLQSSGGR